MFTTPIAIGTAALEEKNALAMAADTGHVPNA